MSEDCITRQLGWLRKRNLCGNDQLVKMMQLIESLEQDNAQLKAEVEKLKAERNELRQTLGSRYAHAESLMGENGQLKADLEDARSAMLEHMDVYVQRGRDLAQAERREARLREVVSMYKEASYQSHNGHWDRTMQGGSGCPECIRSRELREKAEMLEKKAVLEEES